MENGASKPMATITYRYFQKVIRGAEWWKHTSEFSVVNMEKDWFIITVSNARPSYWIGDLPLKVSDFMDGEIHESWHKLDKAFWRPNSTRHQKGPFGYIHIAVQILDNRCERPFADQQFEKTSFEEWRASEHTLSLDVKQQAQKRFLLDCPDMKSAVTFILLNDPVLKSKRSIYTSDQISEMKRLNSSLWIHRGNFEQCRGKRYMVAVDGSTSCTAAFESLLNTMLTNDDHVFLVTARKYLPDVSHKTLAQNEIRKAAIEIISRFERRLTDQFPLVDYSSMIPLAYDPRRTISNLAQEYKADVLVIGKHSGEDLIALGLGSGYFRSFARYCQGHAGCSVMVFKGTQPVDYPTC